MLRRRFMGAAAAAAATAGLASPTASAAPGDVVFAVNAGGGAYTAADGTDYRADTGYSGGTAASTGDPIAGTDDDTLYQSERYGDFSYEIPVANRTYDIELHFAETYWTADGDRVFDVSAEGAARISDLDVHGAVGHDSALVRTISGVDVSDGTLNVSFSTDVDNATIGAIKVVEAGGSASYPGDPGDLDGRSWNQVFADHFDGDSLDTSVWADQEGNGHDYGVPGWGNAEEQYYSQDNRWVENSNLVVEIREETVSDEHGTYDYTSAKLVTEGNLDFQYGRVDFRSKLVEDQGMWPAHWMLPAGDTAWPDDGEIDIMELVGDQPSAVHGTVHGPGYSGGGSIGGDYHLDVGTFADEFHVFSVVWDPGVIKWYVDGEHFFTVTREDVESQGNEWVFDDGPFWLLLNCAVGGEWPGSPDATTTFPQRMEIDYVRLFEEA
ncbi:malectin domain-containing carbohydrate-binding protein [Natronorubrum halophilum]|uniref:malectin domain-containing carbohydrate-binding protein n=1 Tax=Natronorubrum halophilum TaxID=1702106 RepID=UPI001EE88AD5|nr:malectin domain-containing carbohydrate-binding protein [Natronorubrum halophilum]